MSNFIENLKTRFSARGFDSSKKISDSDLEEIIEVFRLSPSMLNVQPWKIFVIKDENTKKELQKYSANQDQVWINSHFLVFARKNQVDDLHLQKVAKWEPKREKIKNFLNNMSESQKTEWAVSQVSIALWNVIAFLADKKIDSCPIWIFDREKYDEILGLKEKWYSSVFNIAIWYSTDTNISPKDRLNREDIVEFL